MATFNVCFILGGPGAGKGTVCESIVKDYGFIHLSAGDLLRAEMNATSSTYRDQIKKHMEEGSIVPVAITCGLLRQAMQKGRAEKNCLQYLVDGFPRNEDNRLGWEKEMGGDVDIKRVLYIDCPDEICVQRCLGRCSGRVDDNQETLKKRLVQFKEQCLPIIQHYDKLGLVSKIDGSKSKQEVLAAVKTVMDKVIV